MHPMFRNSHHVGGLFITLVILSLACSLTQREPSRIKSTSTRQPTTTHQPTATSTHTGTPTRTATHTGTPTRTATPTASPTKTKTYTPTLTHTPTATKTASPTTTPSATPTPTLSQAESLLLQAETAMHSVNTIKMEISLTTISGVLPVTFKGSGVAERPDKVYIKLSFLFQNYEVLSISTNEVYVKYLGSSSWEHIPSDQMDLSTSLLSKAFGLLEVSNTALSPMIVGLEDINNVSCQHLTMGIDLPLYLAQRAPAATKQIDLVASRARGELWVGVDDLLVHKLYIEMEIVSQGQTQPIYATIEFSGYDEPVEFPQITGFNDWGAFIKFPMEYTRELLLRR